MRAAPCRSVRTSPVVAEMCHQRDRPWVCSISNIRVRSAAKSQSSQKPKTPPLLPEAVTGESYWMWVIREKSDSPNVRSIAVATAVPADHDHKPAAGEPGLNAAVVMLPMTGAIIAAGRGAANGRLRTAVNFPPTVPITAATTIVAAPMLRSGQGRAGRRRQRHRRNQGQDAKLAVHLNHSLSRLAGAPRHKVRCSARHRKYDARIGQKFPIANFFASG